ncbi:hypothetical protein QBC46DRAFT_267978, partial [Diplogelasinospora grovesii]
RRTMYLIKWKGFADNTWERLANISIELIAKFKEAYRDFKGNHLGVELLNKRRRRGNIEYYMR